MGSVVDLAEWRRAHPPVVRYVAEVQRLWIRAALLPWVIFSRWWR